MNSFDEIVLYTKVNFFNALPTVATPLLEECEDETHIPEMGT
jgi:hypothetical protein